MLSYFKRKNTRKKSSFSSNSRNIIFTRENSHLITSYLFKVARGLAFASNHLVEVKH